MESTNYEIFLKIAKVFITNIFTLYTSIKIINKKVVSNNKFIYTAIEFISIITISCIGIFIELKTSIFNRVIFIILLITLYLSQREKINIGYALFVNIISFGINYILFFVSATICGCLNNFLIIYNNFNAILIFVIYIILLKLFFMTKKFKNGFDFLTNNMRDGNADNIILNVSVVIIFLITFLSYIDFTARRELFITIILISIIMFIAISKSFQLYYKHRLLMKELDRLNAEIEDLNKNNKELETENIEINKINHTLSHKQKALEHKINKLLMNTEIAKEITPVEEKDIKEKLEDISKEIYKEKSIVTLKKTEIPNIDNMLEFLQEECTKNKIEFELQILGNIFYMTNHYITKEDLEILIADHVKDAIIAVNHSDNEYRSILVRLGKIDNIYSLYIYDSGIEFEEETLNNLGKKPCTTHAEEGGSGLGFMNTFDTLRKYKASLTIKEISKPTKENYTKIIIIKFDGLNEFTIDSYKKQQNVKIKN